MRSDLLKGHLESMVLALLAERPSHGWGVIESLRERSGGTFDLPEGTVYPALYRLEQARLVTSSWDDRGGRRRRVYAITRPGRSALAERKTEWRGFAAAVEAVLGGTPWPHPA